MPKTETEAEAVAVYSSLEALCKAGPIPDGHRAYKLSVGSQTKYVVSNSPGQAAMAVVTPVRVSDRDLAAAAMRAMLSSSKEAGE